MMHTYQASVRAKINGRSQVVKTEVRAMNAQDARWLLWAQYGSLSATCFGLRARHMTFKPRNCSSN